MYAPSLGSPSSPVRDKIPSVTRRVSELFRSGRGERFRSSIGPLPHSGKDNFEKLNNMVIRDRLREAIKPGDIVEGQLCSKTETCIEIQISSIIHFSQQTISRTSLGERAPSINLRTKCTLYEQDESPISSVFLGSWIRVIVVAVDVYTESMISSLRTDRLIETHHEEFIELGLCNAPEKSTDSLAWLEPSKPMNGKDRLEQSAFFRNPEGISLILKHLDIDQYASFLPKFPIDSSRDYVQEFRSKRLADIIEECSVRGADYLRKKQYEDSMKYFDKITEIEAENIVGLVGKAKTLWRMGDHEKAQAVTQQILLLDPENTDLLNLDSET